MKTKPIRYSLYLAGMFLLAFSSCKTAETLTETKLKPISTNRLVRQVEVNAFDYNSFDIKRISCTYETLDVKTSFRANLESVKDQYIMVSLSKLNLPVARLLLTPDSVKMINYFEKSYLVRDYGYLRNFFNADVDFKLIQSILANHIFSYRNEQGEQDFREFVTYADSGMYVMQSLTNRKLEKIERKSKEEKAERYLRKLDEEALIIQSLYIDPVNFKIRRIVLDDRGEKKHLSVRFSDFQPVDRKLYPGDIQIVFKGPDDFLNIKVKLSKFSTQTGQREVNFKIPERYKKN